MSSIPLSSVYAIQKMVRVENRDLSNIRFSFCLDIIEAQALTEEFSFHAPAFSLDFIFIYYERPSRLSIPILLLKNISFQNDVVSKAPDQYYTAIQVSN